MNNGQGYNGQQQGNWNQGQQQGWGGQPQAGGYQNGGQGNGNTGGNGNKSNYDSFAEVTLIGNISGITDPDSKQRVHAYSKPMANGAKVANTNIAVNHHGKDDADFWKLEVWANSPDRSRLHNFLMDHCSMGRKVFIKGIPMLNYDKEKKAYYPTIRVTELIGIGSNNQQGSNNAGGQQQAAPQGNNGQYQQQQGAQPQGQWGGQQQAAPQGGFGGPNPNMQQGGQQWGGQQQAAPQGGFGAPQGSFGAPQQGGFGAPQAPGQFQGQR